MISRCLGFSMYSCRIAALAVVFLACLICFGPAAEAPDLGKSETSEIAAVEQQEKETSGEEDGKRENKVEPMMTERPFDGWAFLGSLIIVALLYYAVSRMVPVNKFGQSPLNPLVLTAGAFGRGSLSKLQVFGFSLTVVWLLLYELLARGELSDVPEQVLILLGISAAGAGGGKITALTRKRLSFENWSWLKRKKWIETSIEKPPQPARLRDLVTSDDGFDVYKFQMLAFSVVVGATLIKSGLTASMAEFEIGKNLLGILGISQGVYVGGKAIGPGTNTDLDKSLTKVRELESKFIAAVAEAWKTEPPVGVDPGKHAALKAPKEYNDYIEAARGAAVMVQERIGANYPTEHIAPSLPTIPNGSTRREQEAKG